jgi:transposase
VSADEGPVPCAEGLPLEELLQIANQATVGTISAQQYATLTRWIHWSARVRDALQSKDASINRLRRIAFGATTEKTRAVLGQDRSNSVESQECGVAAIEATGKKRAPCKDKRRGHGRHCAAAYTGAARVKIPHPHLKHADKCPACNSGKVRLQKPVTHIHLHAAAPVQGKVIECERLRCDLCGEMFVAPQPPEAQKKYDETVPAMVAIQTYRMGVPLNASAQLQGICGVPLPAGTQYGLAAGAARTVEPVVKELIRRAANAPLVFNDDTTKKVLKLTPQQRAALLGADAGHRTGIFTSGILAIEAGQRIALFFTGPRHAGENLTEVLKHRSPGLPPPLQMCDALANNLPDEFETILCNCVSHGRRQFVDVAAHFPDEVRVILLALEEVYTTDAQARENNLTPEERLQLHRKVSRPRMIHLARWMLRLLAQRKAEPNSGLGKAIRYLRKHWVPLTRFYRIAGAPLDNNITERALKRAIKHRRNSLFYRTLNGAHVGDTFMTLIHTAELNRVDPFNYLVMLLRHPELIATAPGEWLPRNKPQTHARRVLGDGPEPPA